MWCIGSLTEEYRRRMYDVLELYARPYSVRATDAPRTSSKQERK